MTYIEFAINAVQYYADNKDTQRFGQAVFNYLNAVRPDIANAITGTEADFFYKTYVDDEAWATINRLWEESNVS